MEKNLLITWGGKITLIQSFLSHNPSYFSSIFRVPKSVALKIEKLQKDFLWSRVGEGINWDLLSRPKEF